MDALFAKAKEYVASLEARVAELERLGREKDAEIQRLSSSVQSENPLYKPSPMQLLKLLEKLVDLLEHDKQLCDRVIASSDKMEAIVKGSNPQIDANELEHARESGAYSELDAILDEFWESNDILDGPKQLELLSFHLEDDECMFAFF